jgi:hypothetical protein
MLACSKSLLLLAVDTLAMQLLYAPIVTRPFQTVKFGHSESITQFLENQTMPRLERNPRTVKLYVDSKENAVKSPVALEDGAFIADLPGFLEHIDEVKCDSGIPRSCLLVTDSDVVIDMEGSSFSFAKYIRRSFHFNCIVKLVKVNSDPRVALFATRLKGPLSDEKIRRGNAILENGEILLPFDGEIPFPVSKVEWKVKKQVVKPIPPPVAMKAKSSVKEAKQKKVNQRSRTKANVSEESESKITLLSGFLVDEIPVLPFVLLPDPDAVDRYRSQRIQKARVRGHKSHLD